jgi:predicted nucleic acid-binding Zn ribbon protein
MAQYRHEDEAADDVQEWEDPDKSDMDEDDEPATVPCRYCRRDISEDAEMCPHCGNYLSEEDAPRRVPRWLIAGIVLAVLILLVWIMRG